MYSQLNGYAQMLSGEGFEPLFSQAPGVKQALTAAPQGTAAAGFTVRAARIPFTALQVTAFGQVARDLQGHARADAQFLGDFNLIRDLALLDDL